MSSGLLLTGGETFPSPDGEEVSATGGRIIDVSTAAAMFPSPDGEEVSATDSLIKSWIFSHTFPSPDGEEVSATHALAANIVLGLKFPSPDGEEVSATSLTLKIKLRCSRISFRPLTGKR